MTSLFNIIFLLTCAYLPLAQTPVLYQGEEYETPQWESSEFFIELVTSPSSWTYGDSSRDVSQGYDFTYIYLHSPDLGAVTQVCNEQDIHFIGFLLGALRKFPLKRARKCY